MAHRYAAALSLLLASLGHAAEAPDCLSRGEGEAPAVAVRRAEVPDAELLARLVHAEATSTGHPDDPAVHAAIAWVVMNRVRLGQASPSVQARLGEGVRGVILAPSQFNPAVSARSRFAGAFLCPVAGPAWDLAVAAAGAALQGPWVGPGAPVDVTPTAWERTTGLSLTVNLYYPSSVQARTPLAPWEDDGTLVFLDTVRVGEALLDPSRVRLYRRRQPPRDLSDPR